MVREKVINEIKVIGIVPSHVQYFLLLSSDLITLVKTDLHNTVKEKTITKKMAKKE